MLGQEFSGETLVQALEGEGLTPVAPAAIALLGMVKRSDEPGCVSFTPASCDAWIDVPTGMIEKAVHMGERACDDHTHPVFRITLKEPADVEGKLLAKLLMASSRRSAGGHLPLQRDRAMALKPRGGASWRVNFVSGIHLRSRLPGGAAEMLRGHAVQLGVLRIFVLELLSPLPPLWNDRRNLGPV